MPLKLRGMNRVTVTVMSTKERLQEKTCGPTLKCTAYRQTQTDRDTDNVDINSVMYNVHTHTHIRTQSSRHCKTKISFDYLA